MAKHARLLLVMPAETRRLFGVDAPSSRPLPMPGWCVMRQGSRRAKRERNIRAVFAGMLAASCRLPRFGYWRVLRLDIT